MKNTLKILGIAALVMVIGFTFIGCKDKDPEPQVVVKNTDGKLTITSFDAKYNGNYVIAMGVRGDLYCADGISGNPEDPTVKGAAISGGSATLKVWEILSDEGLGNLGNFNRSGTIEFSLIIINRQSIKESDTDFDIVFVDNGRVTATFTNGIGSGTFTPTP